MNLELKQAYTLAELAQQIDAQLPPESLALGSQIISNLAVLDKAEPGSISFLSNQIYKKYLNTTKASAVIVTAADAKHCPTAVLISKDPRLSLAKLLHLCNTKPVSNNIGIHPSAIIGSNVKLGANVAIGSYCVIGANSILGDNVELKNSVSIGDNCVIGAGSVLMANVSLYHAVILGTNCTIHSGTVIGSDGFGYAMDPKVGWVKMLHLGSVVIGNDVEIGSNTSIDRGMLDNTIIGNQVIIDNLVQIGHNVVIGDRTAIAGCAGIAGSAAIGKNCLIGGAACINGHIVIGDNIIVTGTSAVNNSLLEPGVYSSGFPARENGVWRRNVARVMTLDRMEKRLRELEKLMDKINE